MGPYDWRARSPGFQCCCKWKRKSIRAYNVIASSSTVMMAGWPALSRSGTRSIGRVHGSNIVPMQRASCFIAIEQHGDAVLVNTPADNNAPPLSKARTTTSPATIPARPGVHCRGDLDQCGRQHWKRWQTLRRSRGSPDLTLTSNRKIPSSSDRRRFDKSVSPEAIR